MLAVAIACCPGAHAGEPGPDHAIYRETTGSRQGTFTWELVRGETLLLTTGDELETFRTRLAPDLQTLAWEVQRPQENTGAKAWRNGSSLMIRGELEGQPLERSFDVGDAPWFQSLSASLVRHLPRAGAEREFWILRPDTLEPHRLQVTDVRPETLQVGGEAVDTWRVEIRPTGLLSKFWHGNYWFRQADRRFLRYRGASGPPGSPITEISLIDEDSRQATAQSAKPTRAIPRPPFN
jgi:hypothetical protein